VTPGSRLILALRPTFVMTLSFFFGACAAQELITEPCEEGCNENAVIGASCSVAEDCSKGSYCHLGYLEGYCQLDCEQLNRGDVCGPEDSGVCLVGGGQSVCMASCSGAQDNSCNTGTSCYTLDDGISVCDISCSSDSDCGNGLACDGAGRCQPGVASCDELTSQGCPAGLSCFISNAVGYFCGENGAARQGEACTNVAGCERDLWCVGGSCQPLCDVDNVYACQGIPSACLNVSRGSRAGVCTP